MRPLTPTPHPHRRIAVAAALTASLVLGACSKDDHGAAPSKPSRPSTTATERSGWREKGADDWGDAEARGGDAAKAAESGAPAPDGAASPPATSVEPDRPVPPEEPSDPRLNAGRIDDNDAWEQYLQYRAEAGRAGQPLGPINVDARRLITVKDQAGKPVLGALVEVVDGDNKTVTAVRTHADGRAVAFAAPRSEGGGQQGPAATTTYRVRDVGEPVELKIDAGETKPVLQLDRARPEARPTVDVVFVIDATGSMSDEIERLKANVAAVTKRVKELPGSPDVRLGMTVYRDQGDTFVTRNYTLTDDTAAFAEALQDVQAAGGGDEPEALENAIDDALNKQPWSDDQSTLRLAFLIADAPPHIKGAPGQEAEPAGDGPVWTDTARRYAERGIKLVPVASSNTSPTAESVFRELALITDAPFLFLTYGADGKSPGDRRPDLKVPPTAVLALDELISKVLTEEVTALG